MKKPLPFPEDHWIVNSDETIVAACASMEISREIVRAVNCHDELVAALEANHEFQVGSHTSIDEIMKLAEKCKSLTDTALAKAKEGQ